MILCAYLAGLELCQILLTNAKVLSMMILRISCYETIHLSSSISWNAAHLADYISGFIENVSSDI